jgi:FlaA1/EpsC-like NDP-sugar epimerase
VTTTTRRSALSGATVVVTGATVVVTGANGGLGREFVAQVLQRGAVKVYATARSPRTWDDPRVVLSAPLELQYPGLAA